MSEKHVKNEAEGPSVDDLGPRYTNIPPDMSSAAPGRFSAFGGISGIQGVRKGLQGRLEATNKAIADVKQAKGKLVKLLTDAAGKIEDPQKRKAALDLIERKHGGNS